MHALVSQVPVQDRQKPGGVLLVLDVLLNESNASIDSLLLHLGLVFAALSDEGLETGQEIVGGDQGEEGLDEVDEEEEVLL